MSVNRTMKNSVLAAFSLFTLLSSCETKMDEYYELPEWLKGNSWEVLEKRGDYQMFLEGVKRAGYTDMVQGKGIITVMAPNDDAFKKYLQSKGHSSLDDLSKEELTKLITFHLLYYSFDKNRLENYKPQGVDAENSGREGLYYKFRTYSSDGIETIIDPVKETERKIYHRERFLPVFSHYMFKSKNITAKDNYEYFYPESKWTGDEGFNVSNASVTEYGIITDNGYIYAIDKVLEPLETIHSKLKQEDNYSLFLNSYDRYAKLTYDASLTTSTGSVDSLFIYEHTSLPNIALEWTSTLFSDLDVLSGVAMNVYAPDNNAMKGFFDKYWSGEDKYSSIEDVDLISMGFFLNNHTLSGSLTMPQEIEEGKYGTPPIKFDTAEAEMKSICSNGTLYGLKSVMTPKHFISVTGPAFMYPKFKMFQLMLMNSEYIPALLSDVVKYTVIYPSNETLEKFTQYEGKSLMYTNPEPKILGTEEVLIEGDGDIAWVPLSSSRSKKMVANHIIQSEPIAQSGDEKVYKTYNGFEYLYQKGEDLYSSYTWRAKVNPQKMRKIDSYANGEAYELIGEEASSIMPETSSFKNIFSASNKLQSDPDYVIWYAHQTAKFIAPPGGTLATPIFNFMQGARFIAFFPTADVAMAELMKNPNNFTREALAARMLKYLYVNIDESQEVDYPFPGTGIDKEFPTFLKDENNETMKLRIVDRNGELYVIDSQNNEAKVTGFYPDIYTDGAIYTVDKFLSPGDAK